LTLVLDAGAFVSDERGNRDVLALLKAEALVGRPPTTHRGVVGQIWRGAAGRRAVVAWPLRGIHIEALDHAAGPDLHVEIIPV
jgi:hypothetical protein